MPCFTKCLSKIDQLFFPGRFYRIIFHQLLKNIVNQGKLSFLFALSLLLFCSFEARAQKPLLSLSDEEKAWLGAHNTLRLGVGVAFPPYMWVEKIGGQNIFKGMVSDYVDLLSDRLNVEMKIVFDIPFKEALSRGRDGQIDLFPCVSNTPKRSEFLLFTEPYLSYPLVIISREDAPIIGGVEDLRGKRFAVVKHLVVYSKLQRNYPGLDLNYVFTNTVDENLEAVSLNQADACIINLAAASYYIHKKGLTNLSIAAPVTWKGVHLSMGVRKDWPVLHGIITKALASISQKEKDLITQRWIRVKYEPGVDIGMIWKWSLGIGLGVTVLFIVVFAWNRRLQKEINEKEKAENALRESKERFQLAMQFANDGLFDWNVETNEIYYSPGWKRLLGYEDHEIINEFSQWEQLTKPEDVKASWTMINEVLEGKRARFKTEFQMRHKDGHWIDILSRANAIFNKEGKGIRVVGTHVDISELKRAEREIVQQKQKAEQYLNLANVIFIGLDIHGNVNIANKKACKILDCNDADIIGLNWFNDFIPQSIRNDVHAVFKQLINGEIQPVEYYENQVVSKNGKEKTIAWHNTYLKDDHDKITGILSSGEDVTKKKELEAQLQQGQKMESIGTLAGGIAHDFNNILSSIIGFTELSLDDVEKGSILENNLQAIYTAGNRAKDLVKQILAFARQSKEEIKPIQVDNIIKEVLKFIRSSIPTTIEIRQKIESDSLIMGNTTQVHQILMNLCTNAANAMEEEGGNLEVTLKDVASNGSENWESPALNQMGYIEIKVSDTGTGISPETMGSIFDPYFTTKAPGEGTGMGLAVVHGIIESYGGKISVESHLGQGSVFTVYLPIEKKRQVEFSHEPEQLPSGTERILFVDDEIHLAIVGSEILGRLGYSVTTKTDSVEALELFTSNPQAFDLVISDMAMPNMTGDKLVVEIMKIRPDIPVILCTGYSKKISEEIAWEIGVKAFAYKPIGKTELAEKVRQALDDVQSSAHI